MVLVAVLCVLWLGFAVVVGLLASNWGRSFILGILAALFVSPLLAGVILAFSGKTLAQRASVLREIQARVDGTCCKSPLINQFAPSIMAGNLRRFMLKALMVVGPLVVVELTE